MTIDNFLAELKRRNIYKVGLLFVGLCGVVLLRSPAGAQPAAADAAIPEMARLAKVLAEIGTLWKLSSTVSLFRKARAAQDLCASR